LGSGQTIKQPFPPMPGGPPTITPNHHLHPNLIQKKNIDKSEAIYEMKVVLPKKRLFFAVEYIFVCFSID
jgi:hypothetical protein